MVGCIESCCPAGKCSRTALQTSGMSLNCCACSLRIAVVHYSSLLSSFLCFAACVLHQQLAFKRYLACARNKLWWMTPEWGTSLHTLPPETQFLLVELDGDSSGGGRSSNGPSQGRYALILPLIDGDFRGTLRPNRWVCTRGSTLLSNLP